MKRKIRVGIIFGGRSAEHEVSLQSAKSVIEALDKKKYEAVLIGIDKLGGWHLQSATKYLLNSNDPKLIKLNKVNNNLAVTPGSSSQEFKIDVAFPVLHGTYGEDGAMQGLLKLLNVPFVGAGVLGSAVGMDKDVMKRLFRDSDIPIADFLTFKRGDKINFRAVVKQLGLPLFIKPANLGSSVGVSKVGNEKQFKRAIKLAFAYDDKILIEEFIKGREIEISVLGNEKPRASIPGEVIPQYDFYSYDAKYIDEHGALLQIPVKLPGTLVKKLQRTAIAAYKSLCLEGMSRVDMFLTPRNKILVNEVNTIPGFTKISMYPKLWQASGLSYPALLDTLIKLALERHEREKKLKTTFV